MYELSRKDRLQVERTLKDFAFEQSPMFKQDAVQTMSVELSYGLQDDWESQLPDDIAVRNNQGQVFSPDKTTFQLGFEASRTTQDYQKRPIYRFAAWLSSSTFILPEQIKMPDSEWVDVGENVAEYLDEDSEELSKNAIINLLSDNMIGCEKYRRIDFEYDTFEGMVHANEEAGYIIAGGPYGVIETHPARLNDIIDDDDNPLGNIDSAAASNLSVNDAVFEQTVAGLREHYDEYGDLMTHEDKFNEFNFLLQSIKKRFIKLQ